MQIETIKRPAVFIDRDGTLIEEVNYLSRVEDLRLFSYTPEAVKILTGAGFLIIVVTNQSGIGRSIYTEEDMHSIHREMQVQLSNAIDGFYFCPHLPCDGCVCRKPGLGMIESAKRDFTVDMENSWIIGDKKIDIETGFYAGIKTAMVRTGYGRKHEETLGKLPDVVADTLLEAVTLIISFEKVAA